MSRVYQDSKYAGWAGATPNNREDTFQHYFPHCQVSQLSKSFSLTYYEAGRNRETCLTTSGSYRTPTYLLPASPIDSLEHFSNVAAPVVFQKAQVLKIPYLAGFRQPLRVTTRVTRTLTNGGDTVEMLRSHACQHQWTFVSQVSRMWNILTKSVSSIKEMNTQCMIMATHKWRGTQATPLTLIA